MVFDRVSTPKDSCQASSSCSRVVETPLAQSLLEASQQSDRYVEVVPSYHGRSEEPWAMAEGQFYGVRVASWVVEEGTKALHCGLVSYLRSTKRWQISLVVREFKFNGFSLLRCGEVDGGPRSPSSPLLGENERNSFSLVEGICFQKIRRLLGDDDRGSSGYDFQGEFTI